MEKSIADSDTICVYMLVFVPKDTTAHIGPAYINIDRCTRAPVRNENRKSGDVTTMVVESALINIH